MPHIRVASVGWVSPALRFRSSRLGRYFTASPLSMMLIVSPILRWSMLSIVCGGA